MQLWQAYKKLFDRRPKFFRSLSEKHRRITFFLEKILPDNVPPDKQNAVLRTPPEKSLTKTGENFAACPKSLKKITLTKSKVLFLKLFLWTTRKQFRRPRRRKFQTRVEISQCPKRFSKKFETFSNQICFIKCSYRQLEFSLNEPRGRMSTKGRNFYTQSLKLIEKWTLHKNIFLRTGTVSMDT